MKERYGLTTNCHSELGMSFDILELLLPTSDGEALECTSWSSRRKTCHHNVVGDILERGKFQAEDLGFLLTWSSIGRGNQKLLESEYEQHLIS